MTSHDRVIGAQPWRTLFLFLTKVAQNLSKLRKTVVKNAFMLRLAQTLAEDKLHNRTMKKPMFVTFCDAAWLNRRDLTSQCGFLCAATGENLVDGHSAPCNPVSWHSKKCPSVETQGAPQGQDEREYVRLLWYGLEHDSVDLRKQNKQISATPEALLINAK